MFVVNDDLSIYATRGDVVFFEVMADSNGMNYKFQPGDVIRMKIFEKKNVSNVVLDKSFPVDEEHERVAILLTESDTRFGTEISKPVDYWYEIELNPFSNPQTIIGYDDDGPKIFKLFPEGANSIATITQGESYAFFVDLTLNDTVLTPDMVDELVCHIGESLSFSLSEGRMSFDDASQRWYFWPTQEETLSLPSSEYDVIAHIELKNNSQNKYIRNMVVGRVRILQGV